MSPLTLLAVAVLACVGLLLAIVCWRGRAALALLCALGGSAAALCALFVRAPSAALAGSLGASVTGAVLFALGRAMQRLLDAEPRHGA